SKTIVDGARSSTAVPSIASACHAVPSRTFSATPVGARGGAAVHPTARRTAASPMRVVTMEPSGGHEAAVHHQLRPRDVRGFIGGEEEHGVGHFLHSPFTLHGHGVEERLSPGGSGEGFARAVGRRG